MKIAIVRLSSLGDIILCMASLQIIRRHLPDCHITWVTDNRFADILDHNPDIQQVIRVDLKRLKKKISLTALSAEYRRLSLSGDYDAVIDLHGMLKSAVIASLMGGQRYGFARQFLKEPLATLFYNHTFAVPFDLPAVCRYAALVTSSLCLDLQATELSPPKPFLFWSTADEAISDAYFVQHQRNILLVPETSADYKNYPAKKFALIANMLQENILICHGNQQEFQAATLIADQAPHARILPRMNLNQLKAAIGKSNLVIGGDSGPTHMAWACGTPSVTLFGATPVCICPTERNRVFTTSSNINLRKPCATDFSVGDICVDEIVQCARELL